MEGVLVLLFITLLVVFLITRKSAIKAFSKTYELSPAQDIHEQEQEWPQLSKAAEAGRKQQEADERMTRDCLLVVQYCPGVWTPRAFS